MRWSRSVRCPARRNRCAPSTRRGVWSIRCALLSPRMVRPIGHGRGGENVPLPIKMVSRPDFAHPHHKAGGKVTAEASGKREVSKEEGGGEVGRVCGRGPPVEDRWPPATHPLNPSASTKSVPLFVQRKGFRIPHPPRFPLPDQEGGVHSPQRMRRAPTCAYRSVGGSTDRSAGAKSALTHPKELGSRYRSSLHECAGHRVVLRQARQPSRWTLPRGVRGEHPSLVANECPERDHRAHKRGGGVRTHPTTLEGCAGQVTTPDDSTTRTVVVVLVARSVSCLVYWRLGTNASVSVDTDSCW